MERTNRTIQYNNAGVQCLEAGHLDAARDLFRAALEVKLVNDRASGTNPAVAEGSAALIRGLRSVEPSAEAAQNASECIIRAEYRVRHLSNFTEGSDDPIVVDMPVSSCSASIAPNQPLSDETISLGNRNSTSSEPALYDRAFIMRTDQGDSEQYIGAINIFNMGLMHHLQDRASDKARAFYQIAFALLTIESGEMGFSPPNAVSILLRSAILNNLGVWNHDNGNPEEAQESFDRLASLLMATAGQNIQGASQQLSQLENGQLTEIHYLYVLLRVLSRPSNSLRNTSTSIPQVPRSGAFPEESFSRGSG
eukprot:scaffold24028_cov180-Amphora_coffeaeformis.AAC.4